MIRPVTAEDAANVLQYLNCVTAETDFLASGEGEFDWTIEKERKFIEDHLNADNKLIILAEIKSEVAGIAGFTGDEKSRMRHTGELGISILRRYWGLGLGSALMEYIIEWAKSSGVVRKINLKARIDNDRALRLYKRFGFVLEGTISRQFQIAGGFHDAYLMGLQIDP